VSELFEQLRGALAPALSLERELGGGGMARVFVATDPSLERAVVVKVLPPERAAVLSAERFRREILIAARLQHPNIVPVLATGAAAGVLWYSMPYVAGRSLRARIAEDGAMSAAEAVPILRDVARALAFAHRQGVVHRDVKPDNVLLSPDGAATVTDFGIAKALDTARTAGDGVQALTQTGSSLGTPFYMAPEQIAGESTIDGRVDLYAFGVMAYEMLSGRRPFDGRPGAQVLAAHLTETPAPLATSGAGAVPVGLAELVHRCLEKDPARRPASADEVVAALDAASSTGNVPRTAMPRLRTRWIVGGVALAAVAAAVVIVATRPRGPAPDPSLIAVAPFRVVDGTGELTWLREGMLDLVAAKLTGEGGVKAVAPRTMLAQWRTLTAGAAADAEASVEDARAAARAAGAGRLLLGEVLPDGRGLALSAALLDAVTGDEVARFSVRAGRDSVVHLADQLGAQLLTRLAGDDVRTPALLEGVALDALRPYLEGNALLRRMRSEDATKAFVRALEADTTFALAGLGALMSQSWYGGTEGRDLALRAAVAGREALPARERLMLDALLGPRHPARSSTLDVLRVRERLLALAPDSPEAWYLWADHLFHFGSAIGEPDAMRRATEGFRRAYALDPHYLPGSEHLMEIATAEGDTALYRELQELRPREGGSAFGRQIRAWHLAAVRGDREALRVIEDTSATASPWWLASIVDRAIAFDVALDSPLRIARAGLRASGPPAEMRLRRQIAGRLAVITGATADGVEFLRTSAVAPDDPFPHAEIVRMAVVGVVDRSVAEDAVRRLAPLDALPLVGSDSVVIARREATRALALWRLTHGDASRAERDLGRLRAAKERFSAASSTAAQDASVDAHVEAIEALLAARRDTATARRGRERLHAALDSLDWSGAHMERTVALSLVAARLFAEAGDTARARINARRNRVRNGDVPHPYVGLQRQLGGTALRP
jgi:tRNA A-37 threonylcarbamoyl transferase component Bud32/TolB-like protein